jgi:hypothetical protein
VGGVNIDGIGKGAGRCRHAKAKAASHEQIQNRAARSVFHKWISKSGVLVVNKQQQVLFDVAPENHTLLEYIATFK